MNLKYNIFLSPLFQCSWKAPSNYRKRLELPCLDYFAKKCCSMIIDGALHLFCSFHACLGWMSDSDNYFSNFFGKIANVEWKYLKPCLIKPSITISVLYIRFSGCFTVNCITKLGTSNCVEVNCNGWKYVTVCNFPVFIWVFVAWLLSELMSCSLFTHKRCAFLKNGSNITKLSLVGI